MNCLFDKISLEKFNNELSIGDIILANNTYYKFIRPGNFFHSYIYLGSINDILNNIDFINDYILYEIFKNKENISDTFLLMTTKHFDGKNRWGLKSLTTFLKNYNNCCIVRTILSKEIINKEIIPETLKNIGKLYSLKNYCFLIVLKPFKKYLGNIKYLQSSFFNNNFFYIVYIKS